MTSARRTVTKPQFVNWRHCNFTAARMCSTWEGTLIMSKQKPIIAITGDFRPERYNGAALSWFNTGYYDSVSASGGLPMLLAPVRRPCNSK